MTDTDVAATEANTTTQFSLGKIYLKDVSLELPNAPATFLNSDEWEPKVSLQYEVNSTDLSDDTYEIVLNITVNATHMEKTIFLVEIQQAGIFLMRNVANPEKLDRYRNVRAPKILFPYAREAIDSLIVKAGLPPLMLAPLDFAALFEKKVAAKAGS